MDKYNIISSKHNDTRRELEPVNGRRSFGGKCYTTTATDKETGATVCTLWSYGRAVMSRINGGLVRHDIDFSKTTGTHIRAFTDFCENKREFLALTFCDPCEARYI